MESKTQGSRPTTQKNPTPRTAFSRTDSLETKDRNARGQDQALRKQAQVFSEKKERKESLQKFFSSNLQKIKIK